MQRRFLLLLTLTLFSLSMIGGISAVFARPAVGPNIEPIIALPPDVMPPLEISVPEPIPVVTEPAERGACVVAGCSSQLCVDENQGPLYSTCEWREEYACYKGATCERQSNGSCGWTMDDRLTSCLGGVSKPPVTVTVEPEPSGGPSACNGICEADDTCHRGVVCVWEGKCPSDCFYGYPPLPEPQITDIPPHPVGPVCGNDVCEAGEADVTDCPVCNEGEPCPMRPCFIQPGSCNSDCEGKPEPEPTPTCKPRPACLDMSPRCLMPEPVDGWCEPTPPTEREDACEAAGGNWEWYSNGCADTCASQSVPEGERVCTMIAGPSCNCGPEACWNGTSCVSNPLPEPSPTPEPEQPGRGHGRWWQRWSELRDWVEQIRSRMWWR